MNAAALLTEARQQGFSLSINGDKLHVKPAPPPKLRERLLAHKLELLAALYHEDATEYVAERAAIGVADGLPAAMLRPVYRCTLRGNRPFIVLGRVGETLDQARTELRAQFGSDFVTLEIHQRGGNA